MGRSILKDLEDVVLIDGKRFLQILNLPDDESLTPEMIRDTLSKLSDDEIEQLGLKIVIPDPMPSLCFDMPEQKLFVPVEDELDYLSSSDIKKQIKHERNPMRKIQLQRQLSSMNAWNGKHSIGKK